MNNKVKNQVRALIKKEVWELWRDTPEIIFITILYGVFLQWFITSNYQRHFSGAGELLHVSVTLSMLYTAPMIIPFFAQSLLSRSLIMERAKKSLHPLLASGISPGVVWGSRLLVAFVLGLFCTYLCLLLDVVVILYHFKLQLALTLSMGMYILILAPLATLGVVSIMALLYWTVGQLSVVVSVLPIIVPLGIFSYVSGHPSTMMDIWLLVAVIVASLLLSLLCAVIISRLSRGFIAGIPR